MTFSIIIPTYNRDEDLESCLKSLKDNSAFNNEVIVLYNLNEKTKTICDKYGARSVFDNARKNGKRIKSLWAILNEGIKAAKNDCVMYLNDDCLVLPNWDKIAASYFEKNQSLGLLILRTYGIGLIPEFRIGNLGPDFGNIPCANYAILNKKSGCCFDERIQWYYGDADIALQMTVNKVYCIEETTENMVIHNHKVDENRVEHDANLYANLSDEKYFDFKWRRCCFCATGWHKRSVSSFVVKTLVLYIKYSTKYLNVLFDLSLCKIRHILKCCLMKFVKRGFVN